MKSVLTFVLGFILVAAGFFAGYRRGQSAGPTATPNGEAHSTALSASVETKPAPSRAELVVREAAAVAETAKTMATPDSKTYAFFENLTAEDLAPVTEYIRALPVGNEQDLLFELVIRRWAQIDGPAALTQAAAFPSLRTRVAALNAAWESWGTREPTTAMARALSESDDLIRTRAIAAIITATATRDVPGSLEMWKSAPEAWRVAPAGRNSIDQIAAAAYGTAKRAELQVIISNTTEPVLRDALITALAREWGGHFPNDVIAWLAATVPEGEVRDQAVEDMFGALARKDPPLAATWAIEFQDNRRRPGFIAAAVSEWAGLDPESAETWLNEQPTGPQFDGANYSMAAHYLGQRNMTRSFAWIRRIMREEARGEMLGNLGRVWSQERPEEFKKFLDSTSLNRAETEMLLSKIPPAS